eukprot:COSAG02_NODE_1631_length_11575_cov_5.514639_5_plen_85_part_00
MQCLPVVVLVGNPSTRGGDPPPSTESASLAVLRCGYGSEPSYLLQFRNCRQEAVGYNMYNIRTARTAALTLVVARVEQARHRPA